MKRDFIKVTFVLLCVGATAFGGKKAFTAYNTKTNETENLLLEDVEALSDDIEWLAWLKHLGNPIDYYNQNTWIEEELKCEITETKTSGSVKGEITVGFKGVADVTIGADSGSSSETVTYPGHYISCTYDEEEGTQAHCSSKDCERD